MSGLAVSTGAAVEHVGMVRRMVRRILCVPLVGKLIGANIIIVIAAIRVQTIAFSNRNSAEFVIAVVALAAATLVNLILVRVALRPIEELELLAERVSGGEFDARGTPSPLADKELSRLGETINCLLDALAAERRRIQDLGAEVVRAQDVERALVSRELHDSIAQTLAAVRFQLAAAGREEQPGEFRNRLAAANSLISSAMEEVMNVSYSLHSRVAEDLGLEAALGTLARQVTDRSGVDVEVNVAPCAPTIPAAVSATLFRVAEAALRDIEMHSVAKSATVNVSSGDGRVRIEVIRDDAGFDASNGVGGVRPGLATVKDRVLLAGGIMKIDNAPNGGTRVIAELKTMKAVS